MQLNGKRIVRGKFEHGSFEDISQHLPSQGARWSAPKSRTISRTGPLGRLKSGRTVCLTFGRTVQQTSADLNLCERFCGEYLTYLKVFSIVIGLINVLLAEVSVKLL